MRPALGNASQLVVIAAIVCTLLYWPIGGLLALGCALLGVPMSHLVTFGGALGTFPGMLAWWLLEFVAALVYSAFVFPWHVRL